MPRLYMKAETGVSAQSFSLSHVYVVTSWATFFTDKIATGDLVTVMSCVGATVALY